MRNSDKNLYKRLNREQAIAVKNIIKDSKKHNLLVKAATGIGKTEMIFKLINELPKNKRFLIVNNRKEIINGLVQRANKYNIDVGVFNAEQKDNKNNKVVVASIPTLSRDKNLEYYFKSDDFDYVIFDEAHHVPSSSWNRTYKYFKTAIKIGLTATTNRMDGIGLDNFFSKKSVDLPFAEALNKKLIAEPECWKILTSSKIKGIKVGQKEFSANQIDKLIASSDRDKSIIHSYKKYGVGEVKKLGIKPKAVAFCLNIKHAKRLSDLFNKNGIKSDFLCSDAKTQTPENRAKTFDKFQKTNEIEVLCVVDILNEGVDVPDINIALMVRPTMSSICYEQQVGRASRRLPNKTKFIVLDYVDNSGKEYKQYGIANLLSSGGYPKNRIVTEYCGLDPITVNQKVKDIMAGPRKLEEAVQAANAFSKKELVNYLKRGKLTKANKKNINNQLKSAAGGKK